MKNYNEMANDVFRRIDEYEKNKKIKRTKIVRTAIPLCCACLVAVIGLGVWRKNGTGNSILPTNTQQTTISQYENPSKENNSEQATVKTVENKIIIHRMDSGISENKMKICLLWEDFISMNHTELNEYYGINVFPTVPEDLKEWEDQRYGIFKRDGGTGEIYWEGNVLNYANADFSRSINIELEKDSLPWSCAIFQIEEKSIINGVEVGIAQYESGYYCAEFMYKNVGFRLIIEGMSEEEMVSVISSLIS